MRLLRPLIALSILVFSGMPLFAQTITVAIQSAGGSSTGLGTASVSSSLGAISKYGLAPAGFTISRGAGYWTLSSTISVQVSKSNLASSSYTITAQLGNAPASGVTWKLNGAAISDITTRELADAGNYGSTVSYTWEIVMTDNAAPLAIDNTIAFTVTAN